MAWDINLTHSIVMIIHYIFGILLENITYIIPNLGEHIGIWFCYCALFIKLYGVSVINLHSLSVAIYKYMFIVHNEPIRRFGEGKMKKLLFCVNIVLPIIASLSFGFRPNFLAFSSINKCGYQKYLGLSNGPAKEPTRFLPSFFCGIDDDVQVTALHYFIYYTTQLYCFMQNIVAMCVFTNFIELLCYLKIFRHMKR